MNLGRQNVLGVLIDAVDYEFVIDKILESARARKPLKVSFLATHGVALASESAHYLARLNTFDLNLPDGQPVRWGLLMHGVLLKDRVCGPDLVEKLLQAGRKVGLRVYFYGSTNQAQELIRNKIEKDYSGIRFVGGKASRFRSVGPEERRAIIEEIRATEPDVVFVGLGCPLQENWVFENGDEIPAPCLAVGAAFSFLSGTLSRPHPFFRNIGLEWLHRLIQEPRRLFHRYFYFGGRFLVLAILQAFRIRKFPLPRPPSRPDDASPTWVA